MGYIKHSAAIIVVPREKVDELRAWAAAIDPQFRDLVAISDGVVNEYTFACFLPDGSKEGWDTSDEADKLRAEFVDKFAADGVTIDFGGDDDSLSIETTEGRWFDGKEWRYDR
jgi:hypothetical protein